MVKKREVLLYNRGVGVATLGPRDSHRSTARPLDRLRWLDIILVRRRRLRRPLSEQGSLRDRTNTIERIAHDPEEGIKGEAAYASQLEQCQSAGEIVRYRFEPIKFRPADRAYYTPDFEVQLPDGTLEFHEVKPGYRQKLKDGRREAPFCFEDAKPKVRVAAAEFDEFGFLIVFPLKAGGWGKVEFGTRATANARVANQEPEVGHGA